MAVQLNLSRFRDVRFKMGEIHMTGGALAKALPMVTKHVRVEGVRETFVRMTVNDGWLIAAATGQKSLNKSGFDRSNLLVSLKRFVNAACDGELACVAAVQEEEEQDVDPMDEVESGDEANEPSKKRTRGDGQENTLLREPRSQQFGARADAHRPDGA